MVGSGGGTARERRKGGLAATQGPPLPPLGGDKGHLKQLTMLILWHIKIQKKNICKILPLINQNIVCLMLKKMYMSFSRVLRSWFSNIL